MRVWLEVLKGNSAGQKVRLSRGQALKVGRGNLADLTLARDDEMSLTHFLLKNDGSGCHVEDLESTNGTYVNNRRIRRATLRNNDILAAGVTTFRIQVQGSAGLVSEMADRSGGQLDSQTKTIEADAHVVVAQYTARAAANGLLCYEGSADEVPASVIAHELAKLFPQLLIFDGSCLPPDLQEHFTEAERLFHWLPDEVKSTASPIIATNSEETGEWMVIDAAWSQDALIAVFGEPDEELPVEQVQRAAGAFARPSVLRPQLDVPVPEFVETLMLGIEAIVVENDAADSWLIYSKRDLDDVLAGQGMIKGLTPDAAATLP